MKKVNFNKIANLIHRKRSPFSSREGRRGFTIVELVVAMAIIVLVSGAAISLVTTQVRVDTQAIQVTEATNVAENAIECFRYAVNVSGNDTEEEVIATFKDAFNKTLAEGEPELGEPVDNVYTINKHGAVITIEIDENEIHIVATVSNNKTIIEKSYTK